MLLGLGIKMLESLDCPEQWHFPLERLLHAQAQLEAHGFALRHLVAFSARAEVPGLKGKHTCN